MYNNNNQFYAGFTADSKVFIWKNSGLVLCWVGGSIVVAGWEETAYRKCCSFSMEA
jgi:hypothetical protein